MAAKRSSAALDWARPRARLRNCRKVRVCPGRCRFEDGMVATARHADVNKCVGIFRGFEYRVPSEGNSYLAGNTAWISAPGSQAISRQMKEATCN